MVILPREERMCGTYPISAVFVAHTWYYVSSIVLVVPPRVDFPKQYKSGRAPTEKKKHKGGTTTLGGTGPKEGIALHLDVLHSEKSAKHAFYQKGNIARGRTNTD
jgi:hypothetical protein